MIVRILFNCSGDGVSSTHNVVVRVTRKTITLADVLESACQIAVARPLIDCNVKGVTISPTSNLHDQAYTYLMGAPMASIIKHATGASHAQLNVVADATEAEECFFMKVVNPLPAGVAFVSRQTLDYPVQSLLEMQRDFASKGKIRMRKLVPRVFKGKNLVDYLTGSVPTSLFRKFTKLQSKAAAPCMSRAEAVELGNAMLHTNILRHNADAHPFLDDDHLYRFICDDEPQEVEKRSNRIAAVRSLLHVHPGGVALHPPCLVSVELDPEKGGAFQEMLFITQYFGSENVFLHLYGPNALFECSAPKFTINVARADVCALDAAEAETLCFINIGITKVTKGGPSCLRLHFPDPHERNEWNKILEAAAVWGSTATAEATAAAAPLMRPSVGSFGHGVVPIDPKRLTLAPRATQALPSLMDSRESAAFAYAPADLPENIAQQLSLLEVERMGDDETQFMFTDRITSYILPGKMFSLKPIAGGRRFTLASSPDSAFDSIAEEEIQLTEQTAAKGARPTLFVANGQLSRMDPLPPAKVPAHAVFTGRWLDPRDEVARRELTAIHSFADGVEASSNILGENGILRIGERMEAFALGGLTVQASGQDDRVLVPGC